MKRTHDQSRGLCVSDDTYHTVPCSFRLRNERGGFALGPPGTRSILALQATCYALQMQRSHAAHHSTKPRWVREEK